MNLQDKLYSKSDLKGRNLENLEDEKYYTEQEIEVFSDLFDEFYSSYSDSYSNIDEAYDEFLEAYSNVEPDLISLNTPQEEAPKKSTRLKVGHKTTKVLATGLGAGAGYGVSTLVNKKLKKEQADIENKMSKGLASSKDIERLDSIKKKIKRNIIVSTVSGAGLGFGITHFAGKAIDKNNSDKEEKVIQVLSPKDRRNYLIAKNKQLGLTIEERKELAYLKNRRT